MNSMRWHFLVLRRHCEEMQEGMVYLNRAYRGKVRAQESHKTPKTATGWWTSSLRPLRSQRDKAVTLSLSMAWSYLSWMFNSLTGNKLNEPLHNDQCPSYRGHGQVYK